MFGTFMLQNYLMDLLRWSPEPSPQYCTGSTVYTALEVLYILHWKYCIYCKVVSQDISSLEYLTEILYFSQDHISIPKIIWN